MTEDIGKDEEVERLIGEMARVFVGKLPARLEQMSAVLELCLQNIGVERVCKEHLNTLHRLLHSLAGSAGSFGFHEFGELVRQLEQKMNMLISAEACSTTELLELSAELSELKKEIPDNF